MIYTDEFARYMRIPFLPEEDGKPLNFRHGHLKHSKGEYVYKDIHTNSRDTFPFHRRQMGNQQFRSILERALLKAS